jgi:hypothetical protein
MTMAEITETTAIADTAPALVQRHLGLRVLLIIVAIVEAFDALSSVSILFGDMSQSPTRRDTFAIAPYTNPHPFPPCFSAYASTSARIMRW